MTLRDVKSLGGTTMMVLAIIGVGVFAKSATATQSTQNEQPELSEGTVASKVSPRDIPKTIITSDDTEVDSSEQDTTDSDTDNQDTIVLASTDKKPTTAGDTDDPTDTVEDPVIITFEKGIAEQDNDSITIVSNAVASELNGTCTYSLSLNGSVVQKSNDASRTTCSISISVSEFNQSGFWDFTHTYVSGDGSAEGSGGGYSIEVTLADEQEPLLFVTGGGGQDDDKVRLFGRLSEKATGTCTFVFTLNGTPVIQTTKQIDESRLCSSTIPLDDFTVSGTYKGVVSFLSTSNQEALQDPITIVVSIDN